MKFKTMTVNPTFVMDKEL